MGDKGLENPRIVVKARRGGSQTVIVAEKIQTKADAARAASALNDRLRDFRSEDDARRAAVHEYLHAKTALKGESRKMGFEFSGDKNGVVLGDAFVEFGEGEDPDSIRESTLAPGRYPESTGGLSQGDLDILKKYKKKKWWWPPSWF
jgi:hypothetical protein